MAINGELVDHVNAVIERLKGFAQDLFINGNTIDKAIKYVNDRKMLEQLLDEETGKSEHFKMYKEASNDMKPFLEDADLPIKSIRQKIYAWVKNGGSHKLITIRADGFSVEIEDRKKIPDNWYLPRELDIKLIETTAKVLDGKLVIPGLIIKKKDALVIRSPKEKK